jgi:diguanylate cyclase (GGDEF)-like protein/PAS domain S-box-containing protein
MKIAPLPENEQERLATLRKYDILDTEPETAYNSMTELAAYICQTPIAAISLVDENRQWFKAIVGLDASETPRDIAFCAHTILQDMMIVPDATQDDRFHDNPLVTMDSGIRFYAGVTLTTPDGYHIGTLCVIDTVPRALSKEQLEAIKTLASNITAHLELRLSHKQMRHYVDDLQLAATVFDSTSEAVVITDANNAIITVNPSFTKLTGYSSEEVIGKNPRLLRSAKQSVEFYQQMWQDINTKGMWSGEIWNRRKDRELYAEWLTINVIYNDDGSKRLHVGIFADITEKKQADNLIWHYAHYDVLTKLPNRRLFNQRLAQSIEQAKEQQSVVYLLFVDLDRFKNINDTLGHSVGDLLLQEAAIRINAYMRPTDTASRMGGDEFTVILSPIHEPEYAEEIANSIIKALSEPFTINGQVLSISASIGITCYPKDGDTAEEMLKNADIAMYDAKNRGRSRFSYFIQAEAT